MNSILKSKNTISQAKINLGLEIPFKRMDGYHQIDSFFIPIHWGDDIEFNYNNENIFKLESSNLLSGESFNQFELVSERGNIQNNLLFKTFNWIKSLVPDLTGISCKLTKRIPTGGGLGGGSSNSGNLIKFIFETNNLSNDLINKIKFESRLLGADIPFFTQNESCYVSGIGEILTPIESIHGSGVLCIPSFSLNTKLMFTSLNRKTRLLPTPPKSLFLDTHLNDIIQGNWEKLKTTLKNEFEEVALIQNPVIGRLKSALDEKGFLYSSMSGSGSALYGIASSFPDCIQLSQSLSIEYPSCQWIPFEY
jgi:4-diphosphocytidyl-2-C-methyl-D-erythritol kinase